MIQKLIPFPVDEFVVDPAGVAETLTHACTARRQRYRVRGLCQFGDTVYFILLSLEHGETPETYVLAPVENSSGSGITGMLSERWGAGFNTVGAVDVGEKNYMVLYAQPLDVA